LGVISRAIFKGIGSLQCSVDGLMSSGSAPAGQLPAQLQKTYRQLPEHTRTVPAQFSPAQSAQLAAHGEMVQLARTAFSN